jgi:hypothetical protein
MSRQAVVVTTPPQKALDAISLFCLTGTSRYRTWHAAPWRLLTGAEHADASSVIAAADVSGRTIRKKLSARIHSLEALTFGYLKNWADYKMSGI